MWFRSTTVVPASVVLSVLLTTSRTFQVEGSPLGGLLSSLWTNRAATHRTLQQDLHEDLACTAKLQPLLEKVALLFLVLDEIPHEEVWKRWLDGAAYKIPARLLCNADAMACFKELPASGTHVSYNAQHFYTIYVHPKPDFPGYSEGSLFHSRVIPTRVKTAWGDHSLATALKLLITEALKDPLNQRFQLLCPATIPLRPPLFTYTQLIAENRSRVGWYWGKEWSFDDWAYRFPVPMVEEMPEITGHTRFHRQFVTLARKHAQVIADDERIHELFRKHCFIAKEGHSSFCVSDEQYVGTALSYYLDDAITTEVIGDLAMAMATSGDGFEPAEVSMELLVQLRGSRSNLTLLPHYHDHRGECQATEKFNLSIASYQREYEAAWACHVFEANGSKDKPAHAFPFCTFFARKFKERTVEPVLGILDRLRII